MMLKPCLCNYNNAYIFVKSTISVTNTEDPDADTTNINKKIIMKNCVAFNISIIKINNSQVDNAKDLDIVMPMYNLLEYKHNYSKTSGSLIPYYRDNQPKIMVLLLIFLMIILQIHSNLKKKQQDSQEMMPQN